jgi:hypothetical protein
LAERKNAPQTQDYTYIGPGDELGIPDADQPEHMRYYGRKSVIPLTDDQLRYFEGHGHQFEGRGTAVAGATIPGMPGPFVSPPAQPAGVVPATPTEASVPADTIPRPVIAAPAAAASAEPEEGAQERRTRRTDRE